MYDWMFVCKRVFTCILISRRHLRRGVARKIFGGEVEFLGSCVEFGHIFLQLRVFNGTKFI